MYLPFNFLDMFEPMSTFFSCFIYLHVRDLLIFSNIYFALQRTPNSPLLLGILQIRKWWLLLKPLSHFLTHDICSPLCRPSSPSRMFLWIPLGGVFLHCVYHKKTATDEYAQKEDFYQHIFDNSQCSSGQSPCVLLESLLVNDQDSSAFHQISVPLP